MRDCSYKRIEFFLKFFKLHTHTPTHPHTHTPTVHYDRAEHGKEHDHLESAQDGVGDDAPGVRSGDTEGETSDCANPIGKHSSISWWT